MVVRQRIRLVEPCATPRIRRYIKDRSRHYEARRAAALSDEMTSDDRESCQHVTKACCLPAGPRALVRALLVGIHLPRYVTSVLNSMLASYCLTSLGLRMKSLVVRRPGAEDGARSIDVRFRG